MPWLNSPRGHKIQIDEQDQVFVRQARWQVRKTPRGYTPYSRLPWGWMQLDRLLMAANASEVVIHKNGDTLDCRRENLELINRSEQQALAAHGNRGKSIYRGVAHHKRTGRWQAELTVRGERLYVGLYADEDEAGRAVAAIIKERRGDSAESEFWNTAMWNHREREARKLSALEERARRVFGVPAV